MKTPLGYFPRNTLIGKLLVLFLCCFYGKLILLRLAFDIIRGKFFALPATKTNRPRPKIIDSNQYGVHKKIQLKNVKLHYVSAGNENNPMMIFLHGFPECWYSWRFQIEEFQQDYHVVAVNMRGYGESDKPRSSRQYTTAVLVQDIVELIKELSPNRKCILVAHDWGGIIGWLLAQYYPELFDKFIVLNAPNGKAMAKRWAIDWKQFFASWYMFFFQWPLLPEYLFRLGDFRNLESLFHKYSANHEDLEVYKYYFSNGPNSVTGPLNYYRALFRHPSPEPKSESSQVTVPTLIIWGTNDTALVTELAEDSLEQCTDGTVEYISNCSHWVQIHHPKRTNELMRKFLS